MLNRFALTIAATAMLFGGTARAQQLQHTATVSGHPNLNAIRQALNTACWNLEAHSVEGCGKDFRQLHAIAVIPEGPSMLKGSGKIPYLPDALKKRDENRSKWPEADPRTSDGLPVRRHEPDYLL